MTSCEISSQNNLNKSFVNRLLCRVHSSSLMIHYKELRHHSQKYCQLTLREGQAVFWFPRGKPVGARIELNTLKNFFNFCF